MFCVWLNLSALLWIYEARRPAPLRCSPWTVTVQIGPTGDRLMPESQWDDAVVFAMPCVEGSEVIKGPPVVIPDNHSVRLKAVYVEAK